jgi:hypothetical protein
MPTRRAERLFPACPNSYRGKFGSELAFPTHRRSRFALQFREELCGTHHDALRCFRLRWSCWAWACSEPPGWRTGCQSKLAKRKPATWQPGKRWKNWTPSTGRVFLTTEQLKRVPTAPGLWILKVNRSSDQGNPLPKLATSSTGTVGLITETRQATHVMTHRSTVRNLP